MPNPPVTADRTYFQLVVSPSSLGSCAGEGAMSLVIRAPGRPIYKVGG